MVLDPTQIHVESHAAPVWDHEQTFQDIMAEQLRHAPWLLLSVVIHGILILVLLMIPAERRKTDQKSVQLEVSEEQQVEQVPPPPPEPIVEETKEEPVLQDAEITEAVEDTSDNFEDFDVNQKDSAFDSNQWNSAIGLGGGAGGKYGGRGRGRRGLPPGGKATAKAIESGLEWLRDHQDEDGRWDCDGFMKHDLEGEPCDGPGKSVHDVGMTGLALLAFLGDGSTMRAGAYRDNIRRGVMWLREQQDDSGLFGTNAAYDFVYDHAIAAYAMAEAYGLSDYKLLRRYAQSGINYLESHRNPYSVWRYQPRDSDNDSSVTGWCVMAYESGKFFGLDINDVALQNSLTWFDSVTGPKGRCGYGKAGEPSSRHPGQHGTKFPVERGEALTAVGLFCRFFMGQDPKETPVMGAAADLLLTTPPVWDEAAGAIDHYYWYYATYALYQMGGRHWKEWSRQLTPAVVKTQRTGGNFEGSWDPVGAWGDDGGRVYSTALLVLTLEAYYRYTRLVR